MNLTLVFSRKYRWPERYFSLWSSGNCQKLLTINQFLVSTIFFTIMNIFFFSLRFDLFSIIAKEVNQIRNKVVCVVTCLVFVFCCALTTDSCNAFQHNRVYSPYFETILFLETTRLSSIRSIIECKYLKNVIHQIDSKNEWLLLSASFMSQLGLVLTLENVFS